ncbi:MAG: hypothetical protein Q7R67_02555 [bacterium]|nr:hypothetical protein [bacterium]
MKRSEFFRKVIEAGTKINREYNAESTDKKVFNWSAQSVAVTKSSGMFLSDVVHKDEAENPVALAVRAIALDGFGSRSNISFESLVAFEEALEYFEEKSKERAERTLEEMRQKYS